MERNTCSTWHDQLFYRKNFSSFFYYCNISFASCRDLIFTSKVALFKLQQIKAYFIEHPEAPKPEILEQVTRSRYSTFCCLTETVSNLGRGQRIHRDKGICFFWFPFSGRHCIQAKQSMSIQRRNPLWIWLFAHTKQDVGCRHNQEFPTVYSPSTFELQFTGLKCKSEYTQNKAFGTISIYWIDKLPSWTDSQHLQSRNH